MGVRGLIAVIQETLQSFCLVQALPETQAVAPDLHKHFVCSVMAVKRSAYHPIPPHCAQAAACATVVPTKPANATTMDVWRMSE